MMYYHICLYHGSKYNYYCVITQTLQNGQTFGQFFELLYMHWNHPCTVASSEILPGQFVISPDISWPPLPPSSPLCTGIICGQVIISEIIPMTSILKLVDHICGDLFQSNGELTNSHLVNFDLMVYRSHLVLA